MVDQANTEAEAMQIDEIPRLTDIENTWRRGTDGLAELKDGLTETAAKLERAEKVVNYVEGR